MKKSAFTLIELLVVISIIAILASLAIPGYQKVIEKAQAMKDMSNMRQLGLATAMYSSEHDNTIVSSTTWASQINPQYIKGWKIFQSPFDMRAPSESGTTSPVSYALNLNVSGSSMSDVLFPTQCIMYSTLAVSGSFPNTGSTLAALTKSSNGSGATGGTFMKGTYLNVFFADGHTGMMKASDFHNGTSGTAGGAMWNTP